MAIKTELSLDPMDTQHKIFLAGNMGTGKSSFAASWPGPMFLFDMDKKVRSYRSVEGLSYASYDFSPAGWVEFEKDFRIVQKDVSEGKYKTVVFDSCTAFMDLAMERALQLDPKRSASQGPVWNVHYQIQRNLMEPKFRSLLNFKCNVIVIAHLQLQIDQETGAILGAEPLLTGQLSVRVPGYFEEVWLSFSKIKEQKPYYYLRLAPRGYYKARSTMSGIEGVLPYEIANTYQAMMEAYAEGVKKLAKIQAKRTETKAN
jgi:hypothetical protein